MKVTIDFRAPGWVILRTIAEAIALLSLMLLPYMLTAISKIID